MAIRIVSKRPGFWRCGVQHKAEPVIWPDERFNGEELKRLMADETLDVTIVSDAELKAVDAPETSGDPAPDSEPDGIPFATDEKGNGLTIEQMSAAQLKELAGYMGMEPFKGNVSKAKMLEAIEAYIEANNLVVNEKGELPLGKDKTELYGDTAGQPTGNSEPPAADGADDEDNGASADGDGEPVTE